MIRNVIDSVTDNGGDGNNNGSLMTVGNEDITGTTPSHFDGDTMDGILDGEITVTTSIDETLEGYAKS